MGDTEGNVVRAVLGICVCVMPCVVLAFRIARLFLFLLFSRIDASRFFIFLAFIDAT